ncbi:single-stranded DNA-binding protein 3a [Labeo rohita]|uniref:single-stranded DNA-binding protein 3a n=1 Tax=Labeo rohita TaxID=84645 RepID=UPI0021E23561|nr:single-stranded DNA-binding protein 3a [Labeo rohita]
MFAKGKGTAVPSDGQAREKLALYVYEYLLHVGAQKSAQTFLSEIRWEKNITLGEPPGFLHSWWCVFWDLYCAAPERRDTCDHSSEAKAFHDYSAAAAPSPVLGSIPSGDSMPGGPMPPGFFQGPPGSHPSPHTQLPPNSNMMGAHGQPFMSPRYAGGPRPPMRMGNPPPGGQHLPPNMIDPTRQTSHPNLAPMQRMNAPRGMGPMGPGPQSDPWLSLQNYGGGMRPPNSMGPGIPGVNIGESLNNKYWKFLHRTNTIIQKFGNSPNNLSSMSNPPGTPRDDSELAGSFLHSFQNENYSPTMTMSV